MNELKKFFMKFTQSKDQELQTLHFNEQIKISGHRITFSIVQIQVP